MSRIKRPLTAAVFACALFVIGLAPIAQADNFDEPTVTEPSEMAVLGDILIARPFSILMTGLGMVGYTATLPFTAIAGNDKEIADIMIKRPARSAFLRCLGCTPAQANSRRISKQDDKQHQSADTTH